MRRLLVPLLILLSVGTTPAADKPFTVRWLGQSFVTVETPSGKTIAFDPQVMVEFERKEPLKADFVCVSHPHNDHNRVEEAIADGKDPKKVTVFQGLKADPTKPNRPAEWAKLDEKVKVGDATYRFRTFGCYHDEMGGLKRGKNAAFIVEADGLTFCHLGDLGHSFTEAEAKVIGPVDVLFIPIGGTYTINAETAKEVVDVLKPRLYVVPIHFAVENKPESLLGPDEFVEWFKDTKKTPDTNELVIPKDAKADKFTPVILGWQKK
ncbi:MAG: MBL fold metallo-hydrolase [Fimbriiglobus sp.]|nr:MBL fold metallo-hydrolase [Fimbriiglobus sp.]